MSNAPFPNPESARVAVVTVSYGSEAVLGPFLASLATAASVPLLTVVTDNKPTSEASAVAALTAEANGYYLPLPENRGYGQAVNEALHRLPAEIEWVVISNPDVVAKPDSIDLLLRGAHDDASIAAIGPRILSSTGEVYPSARTVPSLRSGVGHALFADVWPSNPWTRQYKRETGTEPSRRDAGWLSGAFLLVRRTVLDELGGFDASYFMYFEDVDLGYRIGKLGLRNVYEPAASVVHTGAHSTEGESARMIRAHHDSARKFLSRKYPRAWHWPIRVVLATGLTMRSRLAERRSAR